MFLIFGIVKANYNFCSYVDCSGGRETPAGKASQGRPHRRHGAEEAPGPPAESERLQRKSTGKFNRFKLLKQFDLQICYSISDYRWKGDL
ncbi:hypothetical protein D0469_15745 [Peribacillus saganii]|uniref:Uncharacterized protein n=1 Tax=Peribacillus saganii TaxID=2303992 RepID=A0A372LLL9_9BACI|nr:hypothetical protein D0469_15745 [Peribacillus saganii]